MSEESGKSSEPILNFDQIKSKFGIQLLTEDELILLACENILHTFTHQEKNYNQ